MIQRLTSRDPRLRASKPAIQAQPPYTSTPFCLEARGLIFVRNRQPVLRHIDLRVAAGEVVVLLGANGTGKTTLLQCLTGVLRPTAGAVLWFGEATKTASRRVLGFLEHESGLYLALTVWENLLFAARMYGLDHPHDRVADLLHSVGPKIHVHQSVGRLSHGMRQRVAIARALIHDPPILLLDEPFTNLDADGRDWLANYLYQLRENRRTIILTSHDEKLSASLANRLLCLRAGRLHLLDNAGEQRIQRQGGRA